MNQYQIIYNDGSDHVYGSVPTPHELPAAGQVLTFKHGVRTLAGVSYSPGDTLELIERTSEAPHHRCSSLGNWRVKCKYMVSVWTNIEWLIAEGELEVA